MIVAVSSKFSWFKCLGRKTSVHCVICGIYLRAMFTESGNKEHFWELFVFYSQATLKRQL